MTIELLLSRSLITLIRNYNKPEPYFYHGGREGNILNQLGPKLRFRDIRPKSGVVSSKLTQMEVLYLYWK